MSRSTGCSAARCATGCGRTPACWASRPSLSGPPSARCEFVEQGFTALKWYLPFNERDGKDGLRRNVALVKAVREAVGPDVDIMVDCLLSDPKPNSILYVIDLARRLEEYRPTWLEEPLNFDDFDAHAKLAAATRIPLAFGEHFYTRWQIRQIIESGAATVLQPDANAAGGITEMRKIVALASTYGMPVVPHANESCRNAVHLLFANTERTCPLGEWGAKINANVQYFYRDCLRAGGRLLSSRRRAGLRLRARRRARSGAASTSEHVHPAA